MGMDRRTYLSTLALSIASAGCIRSAGTDDLTGQEKGDMDDTSQPVYLDKGPIVYEREPLELRAPTDTVRPGESIKFEVNHTGDSEDISLGCHVPWAIQKYEDEEWKHAVWTDERWNQLCATLIAPGETLSQTIPLSGSALAGDHGVSESEADITFAPGKYRFVLVHSNPPLAVNFSVLPEE
jgi:hypothetical protein